MKGGGGDFEGTEVCERNWGSVRGLGVCERNWGSVRGNLGGLRGFKRVGGVRGFGWDVKALGV